MELTLHDLILFVFNFSYTPFQSCIVVGLGSIIQYLSSLSKNEKRYSSCDTNYTNSINIYFKLIIHLKHIFIFQTHNFTVKSNISYYYISNASYNDTRNDEN